MNLLVLLLIAGLNADCQVVVFLGTDCPLARLYAPRLNDLALRYPSVRFRAASASRQDSADEVAQFAQRLNFPFVKDAALARRLGATRSPEAFLLVSGRAVYQGRIDDQYTPGTNRARPTRRDLEEAIRDVLAGRSVSIPRTEATGCYLSLDQPAEGKITFEHVAPILHGKCAACHRPGEVAPFSLLTHADMVGWAPTMREAVSSGRMPPWHADPRYGRFANDRSLTAQEKSLLLRWLDDGAPPGKSEPPPPSFDDGWKIRPDIVLQMDQPFDVPAEGLLDYQEFTLPTGIAAELWIAGAEIRPGNRAVIHHVIAYLRPKGGKKNTLYTTASKDYCLTGMVPGSSPMRLPSGLAKLIPPGWDIVLSVHYQPNGMPQQDRTSIALELADPRAVRQQLVTRSFMNMDIVLPPNQITEQRVSWTLEDDYTLHALYPHMHVRGKSMRFEADGEILLNVEPYDFNWQNGYVLSEPRPLAKGTTITCIASFDNTAGNPHNPDPSQTVRWGDQSTDEMLQATFEVTRTHEDRLAFDWRLLLPFPPLLGLLYFSFRTCFRSASAGADQRLVSRNSRHPR